MSKFSEQSIREYMEKLDAASSTNEILPNDNIMNTYCVFLWMLKHCRQIVIYCGEARLFTQKGKERLGEILEDTAVESLFQNIKDACRIFLEEKSNNLLVISERKPGKWSDEFYPLLKKPNVTISLLKDGEVPYFPYHFMVGDKTIYRREIDHKSKKGIVRFLSSSSELLVKAFESYNKEYFVKPLRVV